MMTDSELKIHSDTAWSIASQWSWTLASDTRTLAAQIDVALSEARDAGRREAVEECSKMLVHAAEQWEMYDEYERASEFRDLAAAIRAAMEK